MCLVDLGETAEKVAAAALREQPCDAVVIGAGVRTPPPQLLLFEKLVNVVHELAPKAKNVSTRRPTTRPKRSCAG